MILPTSIGGGDAPLRPDLHPSRGSTSGSGTNVSVTHGRLPSRMPSAPPLPTAQWESVIAPTSRGVSSSRWGHVQVAAGVDTPRFAPAPNDDSGGSALSSGPSAQRLGVLGSQLHPMAPGQDLGWIAGIAGFPPALAQCLADSLGGRAPAPDLWRVQTRSGNQYLRVQVEMQGMQAQANLRHTPQGLRVTQAQYRVGAGAWQGGRAPGEQGSRATPSATTSAGPSTSGLPSTSAASLGRRTARDEATSDSTRRTRMRTDEPTQQGLPPLVALAPELLEVVLYLGPLHHELDSDTSQEGRHALHHVMQGGYLGPQTLPPLAADPSTAWDQLGAMLALLCGGRRGGVLNPATDPGGVRRGQVMAQAEHVGVLVAQSAPNRYTVFVRESRRGHENEPGWQPWAALQTIAAPPLRFASADAAVAYLEQHGCGRHSNGLRVLVPGTPPPPLFGGHAAYLPGEGLVPAARLTQAEIRALEQQHGPLHLHAARSVNDPDAMGAQLQPNPLGVYLQAQVPGQGGCPACVVNHLVQGSAMPTTALPYGTLDATADALRRLTGVASDYHLVVQSEAGSLAALQQAIERSGSAMFEVGDLGGTGAQHHVALKRISGRPDGGGPIWVVFDSGIPSRNVPASATPFAGAQGLANALSHLAAMSHGDLSAYVPQRMLPPLDGGGGIDLREGHVRTEQLSADERLFVQQQYPGVTLRQRPMPPMPAPRPAAALPPSARGLPALSQKAVAAFVARAPGLDRDSLGRFLRRLPSSDHLPPGAVAALPDGMLRRAARELGLPTAGQSAADLRTALDGLTQPGSLPQGLTLTQFLCLPRPMQEHIVEAVSKSLASYQRSALNAAFDLGLMPLQQIDEAVATIDENDRLLAHVRRGSQTEGGPRVVSFRFFQRWLVHVERHRAPGSGNPVGHALRGGGRTGDHPTATAWLGSRAAASRANSSTVRTNDTPNRQSDLNLVQGWLLETGLPPPGTTRAFLAVDERHLTLFAQDTGASAQTRDRLAGLMDAVEPQALDGDYSPTVHALHRHADVQRFLGEIASLLPAGSTLGADDTQALTALHRWFRRHYYLEGQGEAG